MKLSIVASASDEDMEFTVYNGNQLVTMENNGISYNYEYDLNVNMIFDGYNTLKLNYNFLNLTSSVSDTLDNVQATYSWLADGTKTGVVDDSGAGFEYLGSLIYRRNVDGLTLESATFGDGRTIVSEGSNGNIYTPNYFITDHLDSTRVIVSHMDEVLDRSDYYPYGLKWEHSGAQTSDNRWLFNGKELQAVGLPYDAKILNYGARFYNPRIGRWFGIDQMTEKYYNWSPYAMCKNSPVNRVDIDGRDDYFARNGRFLFRDNKSTDNVMIITPNHNYKKGSMESILTGTESNITDTYLSNGAITNIVGYYNAQLDRTDGAMPDIIIEAVSSSNPHTLMQISSRTPNTISVNKNNGDGIVNSRGGIINELLNTVSNIKNTLIHERREESTLSTTAEKNQYTCRREKSRNLSFLMVIWTIMALEEFSNVFLSKNIRVMAILKV